MQEKISTENTVPPEGFEELPDTYWHDNMTRIEKKFAGEKPSPMEIRAEVLLGLAGIPSAQYSALNTDEEGKRTDTEGDEVIAKYLTNSAGLVLSDARGITTRDLRDRYPDGLPEEILSHLDEKTRRIIEAMYGYGRHAKENSSSEYQRPVNLHFLPGGIPVALVGYVHSPEWQKKHGHFVEEIGREARVIAIEGFSNQPFGESLNLLWSNPQGQKRSYDLLMKELASSGYSGLFTEVDGRDDSRIFMDNESSLYFPHLPKSFYRKYLRYLKKESPKFGAHIGTEENLENFLEAQSMSETGINEFDRKSISHVRQNEKVYSSHPSFADTGGASLMFTGNELGRIIYSDALSAVKLHIIGKMMNEGYIDKGPVVDYEGADHLSSKSFFLQYPQYAMEVILRNVQELLVGQAKNRWLNSFTVRAHAEKVFDHTDWEQVVREIFRLPFKKIVDPTPERDSVEIGKRQRPMIDIHPDSYALEKILGERSVKDVAKKMEEMIGKFSK